MRIVMFFIVILCLGVPYTGQTVQQIDIVPTLALLLGLPIPRSSIGAAALDMLTEFSIEKKLQLAFINAQQLLRIIKEGSANYVNGETVFLTHVVDQAFVCSFSIAL